MDVGFVVLGSFDIEAYDGQVLFAGWRLAISKKEFAVDLVDGASGIVGSHLLGWGLVELASCISSGCCVARWPLLFTLFWHVVG